MNSLHKEFNVGDTVYFESGQPDVKYVVRECYTVTGLNENYIECYCDFYKLDLTGEWKLITQKPVLQEALLKGAKK